MVRNGNKELVVKKETRDKLKEIKKILNHEKGYKNIRSGHTYDQVINIIADYFLEDYTPSKVVVIRE